MNPQLTLAFTTSTAERFEQFHADNPRVYSVLVRLAREWVADHGHVTLGIRMIWEVARWELIKATRSADFKLNDHYTGYYARLIMACEPDLDGLFELRASEADEWIERYRPQVGAA